MNEYQTTVVSTYQNIGWVLSGSLTLRGAGTQPSIKVPKLVSPSGKTAWVYTTYVTFT